MTHHVAPIAMGNQDGTTWQDAIDLQTLFSAAAPFPLQPNDEIWALGDNNIFGITGPYNLVGNTLVINIPNLRIYGGFEGWETVPNQRNVNINSLRYPTFFLHPSILDGGTVNRVIEIQQVDACRIDGFVITQGNSGIMNGGGIHVIDSNNVRFENLVIMDNRCWYFGGGVNIEKTHNVTIKNTIFFNNHATDSATGNGGGFCAMGCGNVGLVNLLFNDNTGNSAAMYIVNSDNIRVINNTIAYNNALAGSSHIYIDSASVEIYNSILFPDDIVVAGTATINISYCSLNQNNFSNNNGLPPFTNPNFRNPVFPLSVGGDYHLALPPSIPNTPIDNGNNTYVPPFIATDLEGNPRIVSIWNPIPTVDMGAFEVQ